MKPSKINYCLPYLLYITPWGMAVIFAVLAIWKCSKNFLNYHFVIGLLAFTALGWIVGALVYGILLVPIIIKINGGPFKRGDWVCILVGPYKNSVVRVNYVRPESNQMFVELGKEEKKFFKDMFSFVNVCRMEIR